MDALQYQMKALGLSGMAECLPVRLREAMVGEIPHQDFLATLIQDELDRRKQRMIARRLKSARFPELKTLDEFDFSFNPCIKKQAVMELASGRFIVNGENVLFLGPPGVGKSHLCISLGMCAIHMGFSVRYISAFDLAEELAEEASLDNRKKTIQLFLKTDLLILDEFGMKKLPKMAADDLLELFHRRYQHKSTIIATNRPIEDWPVILEDNAAVSAILDRFLEKIHLFKITGSSFRMKDAKNLTNSLTY